MVRFHGIVLLRGLLQMTALLSSSASINVCDSLNSGEAEGLVAQMLHVNFAKLLNASGQNRFADTLTRRADPLQSELLAREMAPHDFDFAQRLIAELMIGLEG